MGYDVLSFGEALLRLQPDGENRIEDAARFVAYTGGAELNSCYALASLGLRVSWFSVLPEGPLGRRVLRHLRAGGVDTALVKTTPGALGTYWVDYGREPRTIEVLYNRKGSTICHVTREDVPWDAVRSCRVFLVTGITLALSPQTCEVALEMAEVARAAGAIVATDLNYRARLWSPAEAAPALERLARTSQLVVATEDDLRLLYGWSGEAEDVARQAATRFSSRMTVVTRGGTGALSLEEGVFRRSGAHSVSCVDRIGAGDAFTAGFLYAQLTGRRELALDYGLALAALKHTVPGDTLSTTPEEVEQIVAREAKDIRR